MAVKVAVGMSGGVDSSVAAYLLKEQGYDVVGVTMQMWREENKEAQEDAGRVAAALGIPHRVVDMRAEFKHFVVDYFVQEYLCGRTPNPCIACNRFVKWDALLQKSRELGADYIATGHYARVVRLANGRYTVKNSVTEKKDQTYALYSLTQEQLARTLMPVGAYKKEEIRRLAEQLGLPVAHKPDSQDICFVPDGDYAAFLEREAADKMPGEGNFVGTDGRILGRHKGITHYTVGQRKGLNLAMGRPVYVAAIRPEKNEVVIGEDPDIHAGVIYCDRVNFMAVEGLPKPARALVKVRYGHAGSPCLLTYQQDGVVKCEFDDPVRAPAPGQAAVFYDEEGCVLGGGVIL